MGKNKGKKNNVFKVAGAKSFKSKQKAKAVNTKLKDIKHKVKDQVDKIDKDLLNMHEKLHQSSPIKQSIKPGLNKQQKNTINKEEASKQFEKMQNDKEMIVEDMDKFTLTK